MPNNQGWIRLHRQLMDEPEWLAEPFTRGQAWVDLLLLANHETGYIRKRGILVAVERGQVGYSEETLAERWQWSRGKVRRFLLELASVSRISRKISGETVLKNTSVSSLISLINYDKYQSGSTEDGTENGRKTVQEQRIKRMKRNTPDEIFSEISHLEGRYQGHQEAINQAFQTISSTRKSNRIAETVKLSILQSWDRYPSEKVISGIRAYLSKDYAGQGKNEKYLLGIIRNIKDEGQQQTRSTGSALLDRYYRDMETLNERA
jgi:hypothetical protein